MQAILEIARSGNDGTVAVFKEEQFHYRKSA
jgi:hypothetical protein